MNKKNTADKNEIYMVMKWKWVLTWLRSLHQQHIQALVKKKKRRKKSTSILWSNAKNLKLFTKVQNVSLDHLHAKYEILNFGKGAQRALMPQIPEN